MLVVLIKWDRGDIFKKISYRGSFLNFKIILIQCTMRKKKKLNMSKEMQGKKEILENVITNTDVQPLIS
jgi:hypothetical protein